MIREGSFTFRMTLFLTRGAEEDFESGGREGWKVDLCAPTAPETQCYRYIVEKLTLQFFLEKLICTFLAFVSGQEAIVSVQVAAQVWRQRGRIYTRLCTKNVSDRWK